MQSFKKLVFLATLFGGVGNAEAGLIQIELTGNLDSGYQQHADTFGVGSADLTGLEATLIFSVDIDVDRGIYLDSNQRVESSSSIYGYPAGFVTGSVTINNVTRSIAGDYWNNLFIQEDSNNPIWADSDHLELNSQDQYYDANGAFYNNQLQILAYDYVNSIVDGLEYNQLNGWSVINPEYGLAQFQFSSGEFDSTSSIHNYTEFTTGNINLNHVRVWGDGFQKTTPVNEPGSLALLGAGLGLLLARRRSRQ